MFFCGKMGGELVAQTRALCGSAAFVGLRDVALNASPCRSTRVVPQTGKSVGQRYKSTGYEGSNVLLVHA